MSVQFNTTYNNVYLNEFLQTNIVLSAFGVGKSIKKVPIPLKTIYNTILKKTFDDKALGERYLKQSNIDGRF
jgi:hypothetical protein